MDPAHQKPSPVSDDEEEHLFGKTVRVRVAGRVQGVWFRGWIVEMVKLIGVTGWVRNRRDGTVEALFKGDVAAVDEMIELCHDGPTHARVDRVDVLDEPDYAGTGFETRTTV